MILLLLAVQIMSNDLWRVRHDKNKDGTTTNEWVNTRTGASLSTTSFPLCWSLVMEKEVAMIKGMLERYFNWSEDPVTTHRILALVPRSSRHGKNHAFPRSPLKVPKTPPQHKGR